MADIPVKISELDKSYSLSASPVSFLINQRNDNGVFETKSLPLSHSNTKQLRLRNVSVLTNIYYL